MTLKVLAINCTLKPAPAASSCELLLNQVLTAFQSQGASGTLVRAVDFTIKPGVTSDEGDGDDWPQLRSQVLDADILVLGTPVWLGNPSSVCRRVLERLDAFLGETDEQGRMISYDRVATVAVVGNEDGAHNICAQLFQALNDVGFTIPASGCTYWVGEAMQGKDYKDLPATPDAVKSATEGMVRNAMHVAQLLRERRYPAG